MEISVPHDWRPRDYQLDLWNYLEKGGKRAVAVWHRRAGKDLVSINWCASQALKRKGLYWHLLPTYNQGRKIVWDGMTKEGRSFIEHFPKDLWASVNNTDMRLELKNGSIYQIVGTDNVDRLVGSNPLGVVFSEYSLQDPRAWNLVRPILAENGGWALFIYTARGRNHGYDMFNMASGNERWFSQRLTVEDTKAVSMEAIEDERGAGMPEELIQQEFYCSFDAPLVGSYYGSLMAKALAEERIKDVPYEPRLEVHTAWDLGMGDSTAIIFFQQHGNEYRIIDFYENQGEGIPHYVKIIREKDYVYGKHIAPHDIKVREMGTGKSRWEVARDLGLRFYICPYILIEDGIEAARTIIPRCYFDTKRCNILVEALRQYRKDYDDKRKVYRDKPLHDWTSHAADAFRYLALGTRDLNIDKRKLPNYADNEYNVLGG
jgi:phage terminase large subunit